jgi:peptide/nickel transport system ATP-binding protein/oligopeptide transport system ATP-binding protein
MRFTPLDMSAMLTLKNVSKVYADNTVALSNVSFTITRGTTLAVVGESGSGKTSLARLIVGLESPSDGHITFPGSAPDEAHRTGRHVQLVQQDPYSALNPSKTISESVRLPLVVHGLPNGNLEIEKLFNHVGLSPEWLDRYPSELSGGQRQRVAIARALAASPELVVLDEPTSALDVSVQAKVLRMLVSVQQEFGLTYLFIAHDLALVKSIATTIAVLYRGELVEIGPVDDVFKTPKHRYTQQLLSSISVIDQLDAALKPSWPQHVSEDVEPPTSGCLFQPRCPFAVARCHAKATLQPVGSNHQHTCHVPYGSS